MVFRQNSTFAFALIAAVALAQAVFCVQLASYGDGAAHIVDISGRARMQSQRIAYLVATAHLGDAEHGWRGMLETSIAAIDDGRLEARKNRYLANVLSARETADLDVRTKRYFNAARAVERDPADGGAYDTIRKLRPLLLSDFDEIVRRRARLISQHNDILREAILAGAGVALVTILATLLALVRPTERTLHDSMRRLYAERVETQSLFDENPDAIAVYDRDGALVRTNFARAKLLGLEAVLLVGRHYTSFVHPASVTQATEMFERGVNGEFLVFESELRDANGDAVAVQVSLFPNVVNGATCGVIVSSRDIRPLKRAHAQTDVLAKRLATLCDIASAVDGSWKDQLDAALILAADQLGCEWGLAGEIVDQRVNVLGAVGAPDGTLEPGSSMALHDTLSQYIVRSDDLWIVDDLIDSPWRDYNDRHCTNLRSVVGMRILVAGDVPVTFAVSSASPRTVPISQDDRHFLKIFAALLGSIIDRGRKTARLDVLAFSDNLTGLPNRAFVEERLVELIQKAESKNAEFAVHFIDLDKFKELNDQHGHAVGDRALRIIAERFLHCVRNTDVVARLGGDEFVILQTSTNGRQGALDLAARIKRSVTEPYCFAGVTYVLDCSIGISMFPADGTDAQTLLHRADRAMYRAKADRSSSAEFAA